MKVIINILLAVVFFMTAYGVGTGAYDISECVTILLAMFGIKEIANAANELNDMGL